MPSMRVQHCASQVPAGQCRAFTAAVHAALQWVALSLTHPASAGQRGGSGGRVEHSLRQDHRRLCALPGRGLAAPHTQARRLACLGPRMGPSRAAPNRQRMHTSCSQKAACCAATRAQPCALSRHGDTILPTLTVIILACRRACAQRSNTPDKVYEALPPAVGG